MSQPAPRDEGSAPGRIPWWPFIVAAAGAIIVAAILYFNAHPLVQEVPQAQPPPSARP